MCGIAGIVTALGSSKRPIEDAVRRMTDRMRRRGPDGEGLWVGDGVVLGHRRLAILDLDVRANQPMQTTDGKYCIVFNGEIYNFRDLRAELENTGHPFRTTSDTEVLLALYAREGEHMLSRLRGMFALAIWNSESRELFLARDPYGIKPLYYSYLDDELIFASQVKAMLASGMVSAKIEPAGLAGYYLWGSVPEPWTLYKDVFALPAGSWIRTRRGERGTPVLWNDIRTNWMQSSSGPPQNTIQPLVREAMIDSVRSHLVSDVPVSVFLSGGIDSGVIAGLASGLGAQVEGITIGFDEFSSMHQDEVPVAAAVAAHYGLPHHVRHISRAEFEENLPQILDAMDQPSIDGINTWFASKAAAERGYKVVLSGVGGDELFRGYSYTRKIKRNVRIGRALGAMPGIRSLLKAPCKYLSKHRSQPKLAGVPQLMGSVEGAYFLKRGLFLPDELPALMGQDMAQEGLTRLEGSPPGLSRASDIDTASAVCMFDSTLYLRNQLLRDSDWASMAHSLELRTPLVDAVLLNALAPCFNAFAAGAGKRMLARSPQLPLPPEVISRRKTGFGVPMARWIEVESTRWNWQRTPLSATPGTPWPRRWANAVIMSEFGGASKSTSPESRFHALAS
jgi:asparagine synthase (glutamine-hydrolysing)